MENMDSVKYSVGDKVLWQPRVRNLDNLEEQVWTGPYTVVKTIPDKQRYIIERNGKEEIVTVDEIKPYNSRPTTEHCVIKQKGKDHRVPLSITKPNAPLETPFPTVDMFETTIPSVEMVDLCDKWYIDKGGFGEVFRMRHKEWGHVAVKKLNNKYSSRDLSDARSEAEYQWKLDHENILALLAIVQDKSSCGSYFEISLVLEYAPYGSLYDFLRNEIVLIPENVKLHILRGIAEAVKYLHSHLPSKNRGVHCDLKPQNILIAENCVAKLGDFGLAKWISGDGALHSDKSRTTPPGTLCYIPPESWNDPTMKPNEKFDVYAFGILKWAVMTVGEPYQDVLQGVHKSRLTDKIKQLIQEGYRPNSDLVTCRFANQMMTRCWEQQPEHRPDFVELAADLQKYTESEKSDIEAAVQDVISHRELLVLKTTTYVKNADKLPNQQEVANQQEVPLVLTDAKTQQSMSNRMPIDEVIKQIDELAERVELVVEPTLQAIDSNQSRTEVYVGVLKGCMQQVSSVLTLLFTLQSMCIKYLVKTVIIVISVRRAEDWRLDLKNT